MPNTEEKKSKNPVVTQSFYSSEINDEVFDNVEFDKKSIELMAKGEDFARIHQTGQRFAVVGWILKDKFQNEEKKRTLHLRLLPGFGPPTPSPENIKKVKNFYGENNIVIAKAAATSGQV
ncbi:MAG: hypothetical protein JO131_05950, partial [Gammaproteobacteria bacterium]|nr:hypothetical protein [Gammaproteobacteria bacterium]